MDTKRDLDLDAARRVFAREPVVRLATIGPLGPHVVPAWFVWDPNAVYCSTRGDALTRRNVRADPRVALAFDIGREWPELAGVAVRGHARLLRPEHPDLRGPMSRWFEKYRERFGLQGFQRMAETVDELWFVRVNPELVAWWDHGEGPFAGLAGRD